MPVNGFITVTKAALEKDQWHVDYRLPQAENTGANLNAGKTQQPRASRADDERHSPSIKAGTLQEYYLETCQSPPPLQPIAINYRVFDSKNKLLAKWQAQPRECRSETTKKAQARGTMAFESSMIADNVRLSRGRREKRPYVCTLYPYRSGFQPNPPGCTTLCAQPNEAAFCCRWLTARKAA